MKAKELAEILLKHPDVEVVIPGYEGNVDPVLSVILTEIKGEPYQNVDIVDTRCMRIYGLYSYKGTQGFDDKASPSRKAIFIGHSQNIAGNDDIDGEFLSGKRQQPFEW